MTDKPVSNNEIVGRIAHRYHCVVDLNSHEFELMKLLVVLNKNMFTFFGLQVGSSKMPEL
jgi:hypothetical protein